MLVQYSLICLKTKNESFHDTFYGGSMGVHVLFTAVLQTGIFLGNMVNMNWDWASLDIVLNSTWTYN